MARHACSADTHNNTIHNKVAVPASGLYHGWMFVGQAQKLCAMTLSLYFLSYTLSFLLSSLLSFGLLALLTARISTDHRGICYM